MENARDFGSLKAPSMEVLKDKQKYFRELLAAKFNRQDLTPIAKHWGKTNKEAMQDFIHIQKLYDGMVMYMERYVWGLDQYANA